MKLIIEDEEGRKTVVPFAREEISIGRQEGNTIRLTERNVSRRHARLVRSDGSVLVEDLGSFNGIRVNGDRIEGKLDIQEGDLVEIGDYDLAIENEETDAAPAQRNESPSRRPTNPSIAAARAPTDPALPASKGAAEADEDAAPHPRHQATAVIRTQDLVASSRPVHDLPASERPRLVVLNTEEAGREIPVPKTELRLGRTEGDNDVAINHRSISRNHAKLIRNEDGSWRVLDLQSANGVSVNGESYGDAPIAGGDVVELGHVKLRFVAAGESYVFHPDDSEGVAAKPASGKPLGLYLGLGAGGLAAVAGVFFLFSGKSSQEPKPRQFAQRSAPIAAAPVAPQAPRAPAPLPPAERDVPAAPAPAPAPAAVPQKPARKQLLAVISEGKAALKAHRIDEAQDALTRAEGISSDDPATTKLRHEVQSAQDRLARTEKRREHHAAAAPVEAAPSGPSKAERRAQAMDAYNEALQLISAKDFAGALSQLHKTVEILPGFADAHKAMGICYAKMSEPDKGAVHYEQYLKLKPNAPDAPQVRQMLSSYYQSRGQ
ncbi:MAG: FHA domain-containing protein [Deltaproteobacteria bacterium]